MSQRQGTGAAPRNTRAPQTDLLDRVRPVLGRDNAILGLILDDRYEVSHRLSSPRRGGVFYARDLRHDRPVALRILRRSRSAPEWAYRMRSGTLEHSDDPAGLLSVRELGRLPDERPYCTMPYVPGRTLEALMALGEPLSTQLGLLADACEILQHAHDSGIYHSDLTPARILLGEDGAAHVLDWGLSVRRKSLAPEEAACALRRDIDMLGALLYQIVLECPSIVERSTAETLNLACRRAIDTDERERFPSALALAESLRPLIH